MERLDMYCTTVFFRMEIYVSITFIPSAIIIPPKVGYSHFPSSHHRGILPKIHLARIWWKPPQSRLMWGVTTYVSEPNIRMALEKCDKETPQRLSICSLPP